MKVIDTKNISAKKEPIVGNVLQRTEVLQLLYDNLTPICRKNYDKIIDSSKYTKIARDRNLLNYRLCTYMDIKNLGIEKSLTGYQKRFIASSGATIAILNTLNNKPVSVVFRTISGKGFMDYSMIYSLYGFDQMSEDFKYGDYIVVVEGLYDADALRQIYPNVLASLTSNITLMQCEILKSMTDKFIIAFDNDEAGENGFLKAVKRLGEVQKMNIYGKDKDIGNMEEFYGVNNEEYNARREYYTKQIERLTSEFSIFLD